MNSIFKAIRFFYKAFRAGDFQDQLRFLNEKFIHHRRVMLREFYTEYSQIHFTKNNPPKKTVLGLHELLSQDKPFVYSIVVRVKNPCTASLIKALESAFEQTAPNKEVIVIGSAEEMASLRAVWDSFKELKVNEEPSGDYVYVLDQHEWMRVDLLYRYEQVLRQKNDASLILYTHPVDLDHKGRLIHGTLHQKPKDITFPYEFEEVNLKGMLVPKKFWNPSASCFDYDVMGANFLAVPLPLLAERSYLSSVKPLDMREIFSSYLDKKGLNWQVELDSNSHSIRVLPILESKPKIQVIIPYKDSKELTLAAVKSVLNSKGVNFHITAIDNRSEDTTVAEELRKLGCEVIRVDEPFNYSRLNNIAVKETKFPQELVFFLNNDAEMEPEALYEMARWLLHPQTQDIGMVGCRLHYPAGNLQHIGVEKAPVQALKGAMNWIHTDHGESFESSRKAKVARVVDAVTAAACMVRRRDFLEVGGFNELLYPIAYSDTRLAVDLSKKGLKSFYTPYAVGVHHESVSREAGLLEDFDRSLFLHHL